MCGSEKEAYRQAVIAGHLLIPLPPTHPLTPSTLRQVKTPWPLLLRRPRPTPTPTPQVRRKGRCRVTTPKL